METWEPVLADVVSHRRWQVDKFGREDLRDIGGMFPGDALDKYRRLLASARERDARQRNNGTLGWPTLIEEEVYEAFTAPTDAERYTELIQVAATVIAWAEALRARNNPPGLGDTPS